MRTTDRQVRVRGITGSEGWFCLCLILTLMLASAPSPATAQSKLLKQLQKAAAAQAQAQPNDRSQQQGANGHNVKRATFGRQGQAMGQYRQIGAGQWEEAPNGNGGSFRFRETARDDWSVYLKDDSRGVRIQLDLYRKLVLYGDQSSPEMRPLYDILDARAGGNNSMVNRALERAAMAAVEKSAQSSNSPLGQQIAAAMAAANQQAPSADAYGRPGMNPFASAPAAAPTPQNGAYVSPPPDNAYVSPPPSNMAAAYAPPPSNMVTGRNVTELDFGQQGRALGQYRQTGPGQWQEAGNSGSRFNFRENQRDDWSVYLLDPSRNVRIQLDLHRKLVLYGDNSSPEMRPLYDILNARAANPAMAVAQPPAARPIVSSPPPPTPVSAIHANGRNVTQLQFGQQGRALGQYRQTGPGQWQEMSSNGSKFAFHEDQRDDWSVYLFDPSRNVHIQLDLYRKLVLYGDSGSSGMRPLYDILSADAGQAPRPAPVAAAPPPAPQAYSPPPPTPPNPIQANGRNVTQATYGRQGQRMGEYRQVGPGQWREISSDGHTFDFQEQQRDDWTVYLFDPARGVRIYLDLHRRQVLYSDAGNATPRGLYDVLSAGTPALPAGIGGNSNNYANTNTNTNANTAVSTNAAAGSGGQNPFQSATGTATTEKDFCWKDSYGRGVGTVPNSCGPGRERIGLLCYSTCPAGMQRFGFDCHSVCPSGMADQGLFCRASEYGRGAGYPIHFGEISAKGMRKRCEADHGKGNCEESGAIFYPKCKAGYEAFGCCICRPKVPNCQALGMNPGIDLSCAKKVVIGDPVPGVCGPGKERDAGLCYPKCQAGYTGVGPVCWAGAPSHWVNCGMGAARNSQVCGGVVFGQVASVGNMALSIATMGESSAVTNSAKAARLAKLKEDYKALVLAYERAKPAIDAARKGASAASGAKQIYTASTDTVHLKDANQVTEEDIIRISAEIAAVVDPTGVAGTVAAYTYPVCSKYNF